MNLNSNAKCNIITNLDRNKKTEQYASGIQILNPYKIVHATKKVENFYQVWQQLLEKKGLYCSNITLTNWLSIDSVTNYLEYLHVAT